MTFNQNSWKKKNESPNVYLIIKLISELFFSRLDASRSAVPREMLENRMMEKGSNRNFILELKYFLIKFFSLVDIDSTFSPNNSERLMAFFFVCFNTMKLTIIENSSKSKISICWCLFLFFFFNKLTLHGLCSTYRDKLKAESFSGGANQGDSLACDLFGLN